MDSKGKIEFKRVNSDSYGNPRYVCHFLNFLKSFDERGGYELALKRAKEFGGRKFNNKSYGGGIVFHAVNPDELGEKIKYMMSKLKP